MHPTRKDVTVATTIAIIVTLAIIVTITVYQYYGPERRTRSICVSAINGYVDSNVLPDNVKDAWGNRIAFTASPTTVQDVYVAVSAGRDQKFGTDDDIVETRIEYNRARIAGEWIGSRAKEFTKGVISGATKPTKFENK